MPDSTRRDIVGLFVGAAMLEARPHVRRGGRAEPEGWEARVRVRLEKGAREYADRPARSRPLHELFEELAEEGADLGGWAVEAAQHPELHGLPPDVVAELLDLLRSIAALGARVDALAVRATDRARSALG